MDEVSVVAPATVSNVTCGFDCLGFALEEPHDEITVRRIAEPSIRIIFTGDDFDIPTDPKRNVAGVALQTLMLAAGIDFGFEVEIKKGFKPASGIGSSAASSCGTVYAANRILDNRFSKTDLVRFAMEGEMLASGARHPDNAAPCIFGGFTLIRSIEPLDIIPLNYPVLYATVVHPQIEIKTSEARAILPAQISLSSATRQWANLGAFVAAMAQGDYDLIGRSLEDVIVEPVRKSLIPEFDRIKIASLMEGALGGGISGSGPSIFMLSRSLEQASNVASVMDEIYSEMDIEFKTYCSQINPTGVRVAGED